MSFLKLEIELVQLHGRIMTVAREFKRTHGKYLLLYMEGPNELSNFCGNFLQQIAAY